MTAESNQQQAAADVIRRSDAHEGPKNHILAFALSILLTALAFLTVIYQHVLESWFVIAFLSVMAIIQAFIQALFWMHLKDKGHVIQRIFLIGGFIVAIAAFIMAIYWVWW